MFFLRLKIIILSIVIIGLTSIFLLYKTDLYIKNKAIDLISTQLSSTSKTAFDIASITGIGVDSHTYEIINTIKSQNNVRDLWISRNDNLSKELNKSKSSLRDLVERKVYISKSPREVEIRKVDGINEHIARVSVPIIATDKCALCHSSIKTGEVAGSVNIEMLLTDNIQGIYDSMHAEFIGIVLVSAFILMIMTMFSINSFTKLVTSVKTAIQGAINGDFSLRVKDTGVGISNDISKLTNRLLESLDKNIAIIDTKVSSIFFYNKALYNRNPLTRLVEVISEVTNLFIFKNKIGRFYQTKEVYKELQAIIFRYIKYKNLFFAEIVNGKIASGYKIENNTEMRVIAGEIKSIEKRLDDPNPNIIFNDDNGSIFISTSIGDLNVIDLRIIISKNVMLYYSIALSSKKELLEKEKSITRIYNYMREAKPIINNILLLKEIEESSYTDPLTKVYNRFYLEKYATEVEAQLEKYISFGILMLDIDHFKRINDSYGHAVGDAGIVLLTETIRNIIKDKDKIIRYGGEEFVVILEGYDINETNKVAERIRSAFAMAKKCSLMELDFNKSVSIGVSCMPDFSKNVWDCIKQADLALYEAKESGRNRVIKYSLELKLKDDAKKAEEDLEQTKVKESKTSNTSLNGVKNENSANDDEDFLESLRLNNLI
ncbi:GGDEF domain-containing protein [Helicobacter sp. MIT 14-3879]|uniref:GGDEF domain-containing protein n=1 Tax=Helicobacter sp. MIT 14-3879 TaxID=2040649 RepID=UPI000E1E3781|nr:GGDEF domain-containing protein [Helicobacter sp. MIT 14-3879]RDU62255.1 hypothetical protein CQA44_07100 [Helicobacter sp. MIT 14-3879]